MAMGRNILPSYTSHAPASSRVNLILFLVNAKKIYKYCQCIQYHLKKIILTSFYISEKTKIIET
jgi:hypothetical protein